MSTLAPVINLLKQHAYYVWVVGLISVFSYIGYWRYETLNNAQAEMRSIQGAIDVMQRNLSYAKGLDHDVKTAEALHTAIQVHLIDPSKKAANIGYFYALENITNTQVQQAAQQPPVPFRDVSGIKYWQVPYKLTLGGTCQNTLRFLDEVAVGLPFIQLQALEFDDVMSNPSHNNGLKGEVDEVRVMFSFSILGKN